MPNTKEKLADRSERRNIEQRLREEQEFVRRLVACFPDIIVVLDTNGRYTFVSARVQEFLGYTPEEYVGVALGDRQHPDDRDAVMAFFKGLINGKTSASAIEYRTQHKDGGWRALRANASPLTDAEGNVIGVVASARDVTESQHLAQQLLQSEKLAAIGQMVSGVAHELNNPLTAILGISDLLRERATDDASRRQIDLVQKQARKAAELVQDLLTFSRPSPPKNQRVRLDDLAKRAIAMQGIAMASQGVTVSCEAPENLPDIQADPSHMVQVFVNLLANAGQAIASVRDHGRIRIHLGIVGGKAEILIDDDGPGISGEVRSKMFDPFFTTRRASGGTGLGLTICLVIIKEHGGTIEAQSAPEGGARFRILLPVSQSPSPLRAKSELARPDGIKGLSVLVVEDEAGIRELIEEGLKARGAVVETVSTGEEAWSQLSTRGYHAVLCDFNLGDIGGLELFDRVLSRMAGKHPQFLFMTGEHLEPPLVSALEKKGVRAVQKPFQISELASVLEEFIASAPASPK